MTTVRSSSSMIIWLNLGMHAISQNSTEYSLLSLREMIGLYSYSYDPPTPSEAHYPDSYSRHQSPTPASCWPLLTKGSMAWNVNSASLRPSRPASNLMVGTQRPKSRPVMEEAWALEEVELVKAVAEEAAGVAAATAAEVAAIVTVTRVVPPQATALEEAAATAATATLEIPATLAVEFEVDTLPLAAEDPDGVPLFPAASVVVKFEKPCATITSATLRPSAANGVVVLVALFAFSVALPPTAGSIKGTTPRRAAVVGKVGSEQILGTETTKGLKFCSAATRPRAAEMTAGSSPSCATMASAWVSFPQGLAAARRN
ncbi:hypothetical protein BPAE_0019g00160 [Botrytis paeoniae]|uniref:Uncharacterized protein n=1 Tax=Botrytis paeoniae TaxID=278948 RepID=A0A4Z1FWG2_9HELO|nr:hypothetical protein BPAE_0019g00160 [Botrytis paeoniae]